MQRHEAMQTFAALMAQVKDECRQSDNEHPFVSDRTLDTLSTMFPTVVNSALHIIDHGKVTKFICN